MELFKLLGTVAIDTSQAEQALDGVAKTAKGKSSETAEAFYKIGKVAGTIGKAILALNAAMLLNPIGLIIALIAGLVAAFVVLWNNNEGFRKFWLDMWEKIKSASGTAVDWIKNKFND